MTRSRCPVSPVKGIKPQYLKCVEVMSCGKTPDVVIARLFARLPAYGFLPYHVLKVWDPISLGVIHNPANPLTSHERAWQLRPANGPVAGSLHRRNQLNSASA